MEIRESLFTKENPKTNYGIRAFKLHAWSLFLIITFCHIV
jgi:hypothetical protein